MNAKEFLKLIGAMVACEAIGSVGTIFTIPSIPTWYATLVRPSIAPPNWIFGPVWTTLFALMGIAIYIIWRKGLDRKDVQMALGIFAGQFVLNVLWSVLFFGLHNPAWSLVGIIVLWIAILATIISFWRISRTAAWLLVPYIAWVSFAAYLNFQFWILN